MKLHKVVNNLARYFCVLLTLSCTQNSRKYSTERAEQSREHLRNALEFISNGNDVKAEEQLKMSLEADPFNSRARVTFSSLRAKQGGIELSEWIDPFINIAGKISKNPELEKITQKNKEKASQTANGSSVQKVENIFEEINVGFNAIQIFTSAFRVLPFLGQSQIQKLDSAIDILRNVSVSSAERPEEQRVYLALLGLIRFVSYSKRLMGDGDSSDFKYYAKRLCGMQAQEIVGNLLEMHKSILVVEEGLIVSERDPNSNLRRSREKIREHVSKILSSENWEGIENYKIKDSPQFKMGIELSYKICS